MVEALGLEDLRVFPEVDSSKQGRIYNIELVMGNEKKILVKLDSDGKLDFGEPMLNQLPVFVQNRLALFMLRCIDEVTASRERKATQVSDIEWSSRVLGHYRRRNHLMRLSGRNPTPEQISLAWCEYGVDILALQIKLRVRGRLGPHESITFRESDPGDGEVLIND